MSEHIEPWPVSATTYRYHGCRCVGCRAASREDQRRARSKRDGALLRVQSKRQNLAVAWVRKHRPDVWEQLHQDAYDALGIERRPAGRPKQVAS